MDNKVFVIGLDGATLDLIEPWVAEGRLPGFARLMKEGAHGNLESTANQRSASAWTTLQTGQNPGKHGIYEFYEYVDGTYDIRFLNATDRDAESLWSILSRNDKKVVVINVPMSYPAEKVNGSMIAGLDSPGVDSKGFMHPPELGGELRKKFGDYIIEPGLTGFMVANKIDEALETLHTELDQKLGITDHLMATKEWDFFMVVFRSLDAAQHCFWKFMDPTHPQYTREMNERYGDAIFDVYKKIDSYIIRLLDEAEERFTMMIVSDHGFGKKHSATLALNDWLVSKDYLAYKGEDAGSGTGAKELGTKVLAGLYKNVVGKTSRPVKEKLVKMFPSIRDKVQSRLIFSGLDWERAKAYSDTLFPNIRINLKGREPLGVVEPDDLRGLLDSIKKDLYECRDAESGELLVDKVFEREESYFGPHVDKAPDLLIRWREDIPISTIKIDVKEGVEPPKRSFPLIPGEDPRVISGDHRLNGIVFISGGDITGGHSIEGANIIDFTSTVLYLLGCPIPDNIDGKVIKGAFDPSVIEKNPPASELSGGGGNTRTGGPSGDNADGAYSDEDAEAVAERLRGLGYIE